MRVMCIIMSAPYLLGRVLKGLRKAPDTPLLVHYHISTKLSKCGCRFKLNFPLCCLILAYIGWSGKCASYLLMFPIGIWASKDLVKKCK